MSEMLDIVDDQDRVIGAALRSECHGNPSLIHRVAHVMVFNPAGELLLQLRGKNKKIQPDRWDSSVGGHLALGETYRQGAERELAEELGIRSVALTFMYGYVWKSTMETERVGTFQLIHEGGFTVQREEIQEARFFTVAEIEKNLGQGIFTPNFEEEWARYKGWVRQATRSGSPLPEKQDPK
ncbi:MAG: NUDIX domain-containing protein [Planctomycetota bacterium]